jgi:prepilin-type N-terminal cleavage/methylation domain-containing protein
MSNYPRHPDSRGFTLVEMLATLVLIAVVLPIVMQGIALSSDTTVSVIDRLHAIALAESKLEELVATGTWNAADLEGEFTAEQIQSASASLPGESGDTQPSRFRWSAQARDWLDARVQQLDVTIYWESRGDPRQTTLSTLVRVEEQTP